MKSLLVALAFVCSALALQAQTPPPAAKKVPAPAAKKEAEPQIPGQVLARANGTFLGLTLVEGKFNLRFYDAKKKPMSVDVARAVARWPNVHGPGNNRSVLNPTPDNQALQSAQFVRGPYAFTLILALIQEDGSSTETFSVVFRG